MFSTPWKIGTIVGGTTTVLASGLAWWCWNGWESALTDLSELQAKVSNLVTAVQVASDNKDVTIDTAAGQIVLLGDSNKTLKFEIQKQNQRLDDMAAEAVKLKSKAKELQIIADKARSQKAAALKKLSDLTIDPEIKRDCETLVREADRALDIIFGDGKSD